MYKIGYRTIKTAIGATIAVIIAQALGLQFATSAAILTILCIQNTKKKSVQSSIDRFSACMISMVFAYLLFEGVSYHPIMIGVLLLLFIPLTVQLRIEEGIVTSSVIVMHLYSEHHITWSVIVNELLMISVGIGVALVVNLYMPSVENELKEYQDKVEARFRKVFLEFACHLKRGESYLDEEEMEKIELLLHKGKQIAIREMENRSTNEEECLYRYFAMREKQFYIMKRMIPIVSSISAHYDQTYMIADYIDSLARALRPEGTGKIPLFRLEEMKQQFRDMPLPETREEFETRAYLFQFLYEVEQYLLIKKKFRGENIPVSHS
ncbi:aromatic acid exporter family protein [Priestia taiwanensis]|uniref:Putative aromatic acid exporter C-terminal domain-containing protein n=1 Tax=Priestia taiwanensis TaxID=1347902 RepID=A0A917EK63_9BACI|nr:aromatic acid exporter family protein [Priestia taiwanensis]MBM7361433.1 uncharacterized membrane protein YgaE (UPF0421/DUF939 family) [Priestia taiwanensis]GGE54108.1 hypothetical protein GCM10007140_00550 [Priestia taiwanensis]